MIYLKAWGDLAGPQFVVAENPPHVVMGNPGGVATVNGRPLDEYKKRFELMAVVLHVINSESYTDKSNLCKGKLIKIRPDDLVIEVDFNEQFLKEIVTIVSQQNVLFPWCRFRNRNSADHDTAPAQGYPD